MRNHDLQAIRSFDDLLIYLEEQLDWPLQGYTLDEAAFTYEPDELGLKDADATRIRAIRQLRPLTQGQPWGIFFVEFEHNKLPVVALRRILSHLVVKKRANASQAMAPAWHAEDLLFVTAFGDTDHDGGELAFAHFHQNPGDLPTLHVLGWDGGDTPLKLADLDQKLRRNLRWPDDPADVAAWREHWRQPFRHKLGHVIRTADLLASELARLARNIREVAGRLLDAETDKGPLTQLYRAFQTALIHDLTPATFADTYAQTITYGLLTAAISRTEMSEGRHGTALIADDLTEMVPITNPFLREMLQTFLKVGGRKGGINFDELGIQDIVELLRGDETDLPAILRDFGNKTRGEDPVIHFYEHFLNAYNKKLKVQRGVFYTPQPVVTYIVRSVHELLQTEFGLEDGLADTATWGDMLRRFPPAEGRGEGEPGLKLPMLRDDVGKEYPLSANEPFVQILDPATGTATFLVEVIDVIHRTLTEKWTRQGLSESQRQDAWNDYVPRHLLPRLHGYELMMAPYAIAHMKIGLKLAETGYRFGSEERARIYLTNALEPWVRQLPLIGFEALAHEAEAVNEIKRNKRFTVVIGNPPYSKLSGNLGDYAKSLIKPFRYIDGEKVIEKGALALELNLQDDYVKFYALLCNNLVQTAVGIGSYITNSRYIESASLRGMRKAILDVFSKIFVLDLGGQVSERRFTDCADENIFDIEQGVAIGIFLMKPQDNFEPPLNFSRIQGRRVDKHEFLNDKLNIFYGHVSPTSPYFRFTRSNDNDEQLFNFWQSLDEIMPFNSGCIITSRDNLAIDFNEQALLAKVKRFAESKEDDRSIEEEIGYSVKQKWDVEACKKSIRADSSHNSKIQRVLYRPFDERYIYYSTVLLDTPSKPVCQSIYNKNNIVLLTPKINTSNTFNHALISRVPAEKKCCSHDRATQMFPLYQYHAGLLDCIQLNLSTDFISGFGLSNSEIKPDDYIYYIYSVLYSQEYRSYFGNALKVSYPRIPTLQNTALVTDLIEIGRKLVGLHLFDSPKVDDFITTFHGSSREVAKVGWTPHEGGTVWIDTGGTKKDTRAGTAGFQGVPEAVWNFHIGGYQVCEKWLKDRKGRALSDEDLTHYQRVVVALHETIRLMAEIDAVIDQHGGWPGAFQSTSVAAAS